MTMDSNALSKMWHDILTNKRGRLLEEFIIGNRIHIINEDCQLTTFESNRGTSNMDLTIANNKMVTMIKEWQCNAQESFSDRRIITFRIERSRGATNEYTFHGTKYVTSKEGYKKFNNNFTEEIKHNFVPYETEDLDNALYTKISSETDMELAVEKYQDSLTAASKKSFYVWKQQDKTIEHKLASWWSMELTLMRKKINAMRRQYQRNKMDNNLREARKQQYQQEKRKYSATLRKTKMLSWKQYCNETTTSNPWNAAYKLATGNIKKCSTLSMLRKPDGKITKDLAEMTHYMTVSFTPANSEESDSDCHKVLRAEIKEPITTEDDTPFTTLEIREAIKGMEKTKASGEDGITSDILLRAFSLLPKFTTALYNGCLRMACFPRR